MRLLNVSTREVEEFHGDNIPQYAILSHTWGSEEVSLPEMQTIARHRQSIKHVVPRSAKHDDTMRLMLLSTMLMAFRGEHPRFSRQKALPALGNGYKSDDYETSHDSVVRSTSPHPLELKAGYCKIAYACGQAEKDGFGHVWVDTCCIDKRSSAELSEAINSMFSWYDRAAVCYVYLDDVHSDDYTEGYLTWKEHFNNSRWFTRGWTLQELLAPRKVVFYAKGWRLLGTKSSLVRAIEKVTRIDELTLLEPKLIHTASIAQRMSWATHRQTTRVEDRAYSLLGIFKVQMRILYGEGENSFLRLQEEIINRSDDHSIFAWGLLNQSKTHHHDLSFPDFDYASLTSSLPVLAKSALDFANMSQIMPSTLGALQNQPASAYSMTNKGLHITLPILPHPANPTQVLAVLPVCVQSKPSELLTLPLSPTAVPNVFLRARVGGFGKKSPIFVSAAGLNAAEARTIFISNDGTAHSRGLTEQEDVIILLRAGDVLSPGYKVVYLSSQGVSIVWEGGVGVIKVLGPQRRRQQGSPGTLCQITVMAFWNAHLGRGFLVRVLMEGTTGRCWAEILMPQMQDMTGMGEKVIVENAKTVWKLPEYVEVTVPVPGIEEKTRRIKVEVLSVGQEYEAKQPGPQDGEKDWAVKPGNIVKLAESITFPEQWEKEYLRTVHVRMERKNKGLVELNLSSMLWEAGPGTKEGEDVRHPS